MNKKEIKSVLHSYHWMIQTIKYKRSELKDDAGERLTAQYGIEATLPKPQGTNTDPIYYEMLRREDEWETVGKLKSKVVFIQERLNCITDEKEKTVLNRILDGMSLRRISHELGIPFTNVRRIRDEIVDKIYECGSNGSNHTKNTCLQKEKVSC